MTSPVEPSYGSKLLYSAASGLEKAWGDVEGDAITQVPAELIRDIWDPYKCPAKLLPYLAWALGVEYWNDGWSDTTKRTWVAAQWIFKSQRGTRTAIRTAIDFSGRDVTRWGREVLSITTRPQRIFSGPSLTKLEREAWMQQLPQVRVFKSPEDGFASEFKSFYSGNTGLRMHSRRFCLGGVSPTRLIIVDNTLIKLTAKGLTVGSPQFSGGIFLANWKHTCVAVGKTVGSPVLGNPVLSHNYKFTANGLTVGSPEFRVPVFAAATVKPVTPNHLIVQKPVLGSPALTQKHVITANGLTVGSPEASFAHKKFTANNLVVGAPFLGRPIFVLQKGQAPTPTIALSRLKRRAVWVENQVETDTRVTEFGSFFRLHRSAPEDGKVFTNRPFNLRRHYIPSDAWKRLITIQPTPRLPWRGPVTPSLQAVTSEPELVKIPHFPPSGGKNYNSFSGEPMWGKFLIPSSARFRRFERYAVLDPTVRLLRRTPIQFMGVGRYGFPAFTAWVHTTVGKRLSPWAAGYGFMLPKTKFFVPHDGEPTRQVRLAIQAAKTLRDKVLIRTGRRPLFLAAGTPVLADIDTVIVGRPV